jgi:hypothetical protein
VTKEKVRTTKAAAAWQPSGTSPGLYHYVAKEAKTPRFACVGTWQPVPLTNAASSTDVLARSRTADIATVNIVSTTAL